MSETTHKQHTTTHNNTPQHTTTTHNNTPIQQQHNSNPTTTQQQQNNTPQHNNTTATNQQQHNSNNTTATQQQHSNTTATTQQQHNNNTTTTQQQHNNNNKFALCDPERQPRTSSSYAAVCSLQAFVNFPLSQVFRLHVGGFFRLPALSRRSAHGAPAASCAHKPALTRQLPWPLRPELSMHSWSQCVKTQLRLSLSPTTFCVVADAAKRCPPSITYEDEVHRRGPRTPLPSRCLRRRPRLAVQLVCCTQASRTSFRNRTRRLRACMFLVLGCIRLASSFTANYSSHLS